MDVLDPERLPRAASYLAALPAGLASHPRCRVRTIVTRVIAERFPQVLEHPGIAPAFAADLRETLARNEWMPEVPSIVSRLLVRDVALATDDEFKRWNFDVAKDLFAQPFYRALMYVLSPTLVLLGAQRRWAAFREGTVLSATTARNKAAVTLTFPDRLYPSLVLGGYGEAFRASLVAARARDVAVNLVEETDTRAHWDVTWA